MENLISVIVTAYNEEKNIERCVRSIFSQTYDSIELIVVNDGSTDNTALILERLSENFNIKCINISNAGVSNARNIGLQYATGNWIIFSDSDDFYYPDAFECLLQVAKSTNCQIIQGGLNTSSDVVTINKCAIIPSGVIQKCLLSNNAINQDAYDILDSHMRQSIHGVYGKLIKRNLCEDLTFRKDMRLGEDLLYYFQLLIKCDKIALVQKDVYHVYVNSNSSTRRYNPSMLAASNIFCEVMKDLLTENKLFEQLKAEYFNQVYMHLNVALSTSYFHKECPLSFFDKVIKTNIFLNKDYYHNSLKYMFESSKSLKTKIKYLLMKRFILGYFIYQKLNRLV